MSEFDRREAIALLRSEYLDVIGALSLQASNAVPAVEVNVSALPDVSGGFAVPDDQAEAMPDRITKGGTRQRYVYIAHFAEMTGYERLDGVLAAQISSARAGLFADRGLTPPLQEFDMLTQAQADQAQDSDLAILGLRLGMTEMEARAAIAENKPELGRALSGNVDPVRRME